MVRGFFVQSKIRAGLPSRIAKSGRITMCLDSHLTGDRIFAWLSSTFLYRFVPSVRAYDRWSQVTCIPSRFRH